MSGSEVKFAVVGLDGHGPVFAKVVNGPEPLVPGARVVAAMPVPSVMVSEETLAQNVAQTRALGVEILEDPAELASRADGILILHDDGSQHLALARLFAPFGKPLFVDKPFEATARAAAEMVALCRSQGCPLFSASSLRFAPELQAALARSEAGRVLSCLTYSPYSPQPTMPGWIYYAIHAVEPLFQIMGCGCREVRCFPVESGSVALGLWEDGRLGMAKANEGGTWGYGFTLWRENDQVATAVDAGGIYPALLARVKAFVQTGESPVPPEQSVEVIAFLEAANASMAAGGAPVTLAC